MLKIFSVIGVVLFQVREVRSKRGNSYDGYNDDNGNNYKR